MIKPTTREAYLEPVKDMAPEIKELKKELNPTRWYNYVIGGLYLDTKEQKYLNELLGLNPNEGIDEAVQKNLTYMTKFTPEQITYLENALNLISWQTKEWINEFHLPTWSCYIRDMLRRGEYKSNSKDADDLNKLSKLYKLLA